MLVVAPDPDKIKQARVNARLRREDAATALGMGYSTITNWERGKTEPRLSGIKAMARLYGVAEGDLYSEYEE
jgi:transcriptional regulator with XRE-family HTH domain